MKAVSCVKPVTNSLCVTKTEVTEKAKASTAPPVDEQIAGSSRTDSSKRSS